MLVCSSGTPAPPPSPPRCHRYPESPPPAPHSSFPFHLGPRKRGNPFSPGAYSPGLGAGIQDWESCSPGSGTSSCGHAAYRRRSGAYSWGSLAYSRGSLAYSRGSLACTPGSGACTRGSGPCSWGSGPCSCDCSSS